MSLCGHDFISFGLYGRYILNFLRRWSDCSLRQAYIVHSHWPWVSVLVDPHPCQFWHWFYCIVLASAREYTSGLFNDCQSPFSAAFCLFLLTAPPNWPSPGLSLPPTQAPCISLQGLFKRRAEGACALFKTKAWFPSVGIHLSWNTSMILQDLPCWLTPGPNSQNPVFLLFFFNLIFKISIYFGCAGSYLLLGLFL